MLQTNYFISGRTADPKTLSNQSLVGGKGKGLHLLMQVEDIQVPPYCVTSTDAFRNTITAQHQIAPKLAVLDELSQHWIHARLKNDVDRLAEFDRRIKEISSDIKSRICESLLPQGFSCALRRFVKAELGETGELAARSSAIGEDSLLSSFSGQYRSRLDVLLSALDQAVLDVWRSFFEPNAIQARNNASLYHLALKALSDGKDLRELDENFIGRHYLLPNSTTTMAVVFMKMLKSTAAGTCYSINPSTKEFGTFFELSDCGYKVVDGAETPKFRVFFDRSGAPSEVLPPGHSKLEESIEAVRLGAQRVFSAARDKYGCTHVDTEIVIAEGGQNWFLQVRPYLVSCLSPNLVLDTSGLTEILHCPGSPIVAKPASGRAIVGNSDIHTEEIHLRGTIAPGDILITDKFNANFEASAHLLAGMVTELGGFSCHAANVASQHGIPSIVGAVGAVEALRPFNGQIISIDPAACAVYLGKGAIKEGAAPRKQSSAAKPQGPKPTRKWWDYEFEGVKYFGKPAFPLKGIQFEAYIEGFKQLQDHIREIFHVSTSIPYRLIQEERGATIILPCESLDEVDDRILDGPVEDIQTWFDARKAAAGKFFDLTDSFDGSAGKLVPLYDAYAAMIGFFHLRGDVKIYTGRRFESLLRQHNISTESMRHIQALLFSNGRTIETKRCSDEMIKLVSAARGNAHFQNSGPSEDILDRMEQAHDPLLTHITWYSQQFMIEHTEDWRHAPRAVALKVVDELKKALSSPNPAAIPANHYVPLAELQHTLSRIGSVAEVQTLLKLAKLVFEIDFAHEFEHHAQIRAQWTIANKLVAARPDIGWTITEHTLQDLARELPGKI